MPTGIYTHHKLSEETKKKLSLIKKGKMPKNIKMIAGWNKGKKCPWITERMKGINNPMKNPEIIKKISISKIGKIPSNINQLKEMLKGNKYAKGRIMNLKEREYRSQILKNYFNNHPNHIKKILKRNNKSSLEIKFESIINKLGLPYKFVGNGEIIIARKCPDFINLDGEKIAIDVYYRKHKDKFRNGLEEWKAERIKIFNQEGWKLILLDETQINEKSIDTMLKGGKY